MLDSQRRRTHRRQLDVERILLSTSSRPRREDRARAIDVTTRSRTWSYAPRRSRPAPAGLGPGLRSFEGLDALPASGEPYPGELRLQ
jgi:hypothetical protein